MGHFSTVPHHLAGTFTHDQVEVAAAHAGVLREGHLAIFRFENLRQGAQRLRCESPRWNPLVFIARGEDGQFSSPRGNHLPVGEQDVTQVDSRLVIRQRLFPNFTFGKHHLQFPARPILDGRETEPARVPGKHDPASDANEIIRFGARFKVPVAVTHLLDGGRYGHFNRVGVNASFKKPGALFAADPDLLRDVWGGGIFFVAHSAMVDQAKGEPEPLGG